VPLMVFIWCCSGGGGRPQARLCARSRTYVNKQNSKWMAEIKIQIKSK
jgi:hypothetical protein